jgi:hypothetical protein
VFVNFEDPVLAMDSPSNWVATANSDGTGANLTSSITLKSTDVFAKAAKIVFSNNTGTNAYLTALTLYGRVVRATSDLYYRTKDDSSVTAYQERIFTLENPYIQSQSWAQSYASIILEDFSSVEKIQKIKIRAIPELQLGDLVSWQGRYWRIYDIKSILDSSNGFVQELTMIQRTIRTYFRIGISTIGGTDIIAP